MQQRRRDSVFLNGAFVVLCAFPWAALAQSGYVGYAAFVNPSSNYSLAVGQSFATPVVTVASAPQPADQFTMTVAVLGGCGTLGGATSVQVEVLPDPYDPPGSRRHYYGSPPRFTATAPGSCTLRASWRNTQQDLHVEVYDAASLRIEPLYPMVAISEGGTSSDVQARVVDSAGRPAQGKRVRYEADTRCALIGIVESYRESITGSTGIASIPAVLAFRGTPGYCTLTATLVESGARAALGILIYDPAQATVTATPDAVASFTGEAFQVTALVRDADGNVLPRVPIAVRSSASVGGADIVGSRTTSRTGANGAYRFGATANAVAGRYELVVGAVERDFRISVVQSVRGQPAPRAPAAPTQSLQDMWWGGPAESGWGVSIVHHGDTLFSVIYAYDDHTPDWYVMPGGAWDATHTRYTGALYRTHGTPFHSYDASKLTVDRFVGSASLIFADGDHATLDFNLRGNTLGGSVGRKALVRQPFGSGVAPLAGVGDMWWGGEAQNGWGIAILQQAGTLFCVWFTYDDLGTPTWYVMPGGTWTAGDTYEGRLFTTWGNSWITGYRAGDLQATDVGPYRLHFNRDGTATFNYTIGNRSGTLPLRRQPF